jgi:hypothetical protein
MWYSSWCRACWIRRSTTVGIPSRRTPPSGLGISTRRTGRGLYVPPRSSSLIHTQCSMSQGLRSAVSIPSIPAAPLFLRTCFSASCMFCCDSTRSIRSVPFRQGRSPVRAVGRLGTAGGCGLATSLRRSSPLEIFCCLCLPCELTGSSPFFMFGPSLRVLSLGYYGLC